MPKQFALRSPARKSEQYVGDHRADRRTPRGFPRRRRRWEFGPSQEVSRGSGFGSASRAARSARVGEGGCVAADAAVMKVQRVVVHAQLVREEFLAVAIVAGDHAGHGLGTVIPVADAHAEVTVDT